MPRFSAPSTLVLLFAFAACISPAAADDTDSANAPVKVVAPHLLTVKTARGKGQLPVYVTLDGVYPDLTKPQPTVTRALLIFHGKLRNADVYNESGLKAIHTAGDAGKTTILFTPQFLEQVDTRAFHLAPTVLAWAPQAWMSGDDATNVPVSSFDAIDSILTQLGNRAMYPNLKTVVIAGHSAGGQIVQRYAVVGKAGEALVAEGIHVRYVIANPSSMVYFSPDRPNLEPKGDFTFGRPAKTCYGKYDLWKYGINEPPPYAADSDWKATEQRYVGRDVRYLLGTADTDPNHPALDKSCSGEVEGPYRFFRGKAYFRYMENRHPELAKANATQQLWYVPGVEHDGDKMLNSTCGIAALFDIGTCTTQVLDPKP